MAGNYLSIIQGDTYTFSTNIAVNNVVQNIAGASLWFLAKVNRDDVDSNAIINASTGSGQIVISGNNSNVVTMTLNANTTANYTQSNVLYWALKAQTSVGANYTLDRGRCCVMLPGVGLT